MVRKIFVSIGIVIAVAVAMKVFKFGPMDIIRGLDKTADHATSDIKSLMSGEFKKGQKPDLTPDTAPNADAETIRMNKELAAERQRYLEQRADYLKQQTENLKKGDSEAFQKEVKRQAEEAKKSRQ